MEIINFVKEYLETVFGHLNISPELEITNQDDKIAVKIVADNLNFLIGSRGESLEGLQILLGQAAFQKFGAWNEIYIDINDYRERKREKIEEIAKTYIDRVRFFTKEISLPAMSASERKFVHEFVANYDDMASFSVGEGASRRVVLKIR